MSEAARDLLDELQAEGFQLRLVLGEVQVRPVAQLPDALRTRLRDLRPEVVTELACPEERARCPDCGNAWRYDYKGTRRCVRCEGLPPMFGAYCGPARPSRWAVAEVLRIEAQALALGWPRERLWATVGWNVGLVAMLGEGDVVEAVSASEIVIRRACPDGRVPARPVIRRERGRSLNSLLQETA